MAPRDALAPSDPGLEPEDAEETPRPKSRKQAKDGPRLVAVDGDDDEDENLPRPADEAEGAPKKKRKKKTGAEASPSEDKPKKKKSSSKSDAGRSDKAKSKGKKKKGDGKKGSSREARKRSPHRSPSLLTSAPLRRELGGVALFALGVLALLALVSYDPADPGFGKVGLPDVSNLIGPFGAYLADCLTLLLGLGAFIAPAVLFAVGVICFRPLIGRPQLHQVLGGALLFVGLATFLDVVGGRAEWLPYPAGGLTGAVVAGLLVPWLYSLGTGLVSLLVTLVGANVLIGRPLGQTAADLGRFGRWIVGYVKEEFHIYLEKERLLREERERLVEEMREEQERLDADKDPDAEAEAKEQARKEKAEARARAEVERLEAEAAAAAAAAAAEDAPTVVTLTPRGGADPAWALAGGPTDPGGAPAGLDKAIEEPAVDGKKLGLTSLAPDKAAPNRAAPDKAAAAAPTPAAKPAAKSADGKPSADKTDDKAAAKPAAAPEAKPKQKGEKGEDKSDEGLVIVEREEEDGARLVAEAEEQVQEAEEFELPPLKLLDYDAPERVAVDPAHLQQQAQTLLSKFRDFGIDGKVREVRPGPVCTTYEFVPAPGIKVSRIAALADDIAMAMEAVHVRIVAPIPGKGAVGIEIPNDRRETVFLKEVIASPAFREKDHKLTMALGKDIEGKPYTANLAQMPHVLISGTTGSGKSVSVNGMICSILYRANPDDVKFLMIDPKMLELSIYEGIPHLLLPPITDSKKAAVALRWAVEEMERRYQAMSDMGTRDVEGFNEMLRDIKSGDLEKEVPKMPDGKPWVKMPYIVIVVDEYADLLAIAGKDVEGYIMRLAQKARAAGIHVMLATQRPSVDVITGVIKANFPVRMGFRLASSHDSKTIVNRPGAEKLLGRGDMLIMPPGTSNLTRVHGAFISEKELHRVVGYLKKQKKPDYKEDILKTPEEDESGGASDEDKDARWDDAINVVARGRKCSTSWLQRQLGIGYNRAARIVEMMEREGLVGPQINAKGDREIHLPPPHDE